MKTKRVKMLTIRVNRREANIFKEAAKYHRTSVAVMVRHVINEAAKRAGLFLLISCGGAPFSLADQAPDSGNFFNDADDAGLAQTRLPEPDAPDGVATQGDAKDASGSILEALAPTPDASWPGDAHDAAPQPEAAPIEASPPIEAAPPPPVCSPGETRCNANAQGVQQLQTCAGNAWSDTPCSDGAWCVMQSQVPTCYCGGSDFYCSGVCVDPLVGTPGVGGLGPTNCGSCGTTCRVGASCVGGQCE